MSDFTQSDLDAINKAIATGALKVKYNDREVTYRSLDELLQARDLIKRALGLSKGGGRVYAKASKGTC